MTIDHMEEQINIDLSRLQRQALERYLKACIVAGEAKVAEEIRAAMAVQDEAEHRRLAA